MSPLLVCHGYLLAATQWNNALMICRTGREYLIDFNGVKAYSLGDKTYVNDGKLTDCSFVLDRDMSTIMGDI